MGRRGLGYCFLQQGACCICLEHTRVGEMANRATSFSLGAGLKTSRVCNPLWQTESLVEASASRAGVRFQALQVVDSAQPRLEMSMGLSSAALGSARPGLGAGLGGSRQCSEPSRGPDGEGRVASASEGPRRHSETLGEGRANEVVVGRWEGWQSNFAST